MIPTTCANTTVSSLETVGRSRYVNVLTKVGESPGSRYIFCFVVLFYEATLQPCSEEVANPSLLVQYLYSLVVDRSRTYTREKAGDVLLCMVCSDFRGARGFDEKAERPRRLETFLWRPGFCLLCMHVCVCACVRVCVFVCVSACVCVCVRSA
jgi:hypothetical protein